jgi:hypothetical protein
MPKHKQSSSPNKKGMYQTYKDTGRAFANKVRDLQRHIKKHTSFVYDEGSITQGSYQCSDTCAVEALKRLRSAKTWKK